LSEQNQFPENQQYEQLYTITPEPPKKRGLGVFLNIILFIAAFLSTTLAGVQWLNRDPYDLKNFKYGLTYSILIMFFLSCHEFGHYFAAKIHKVKVTLPFYIPFPLFLNPFGTMGAVIRMKSPARSRKALFDIGIAGPVAGFIAAVAMLIYGMTHLPSIEYLYSIHPEYQMTGIPLSGGFSFGQTGIFWVLSKLLTSSPNVFLPPMNEVYHYPFLCVGWFGLLVTALNLLPVGQLDGGHITYALFGSKHKIIARVFFIGMVGLGLIGLAQLALSYFDIPFLAGYGFLNWLIWSLLIFFVIKVDHPSIYDPEPIGLKRRLWGIFALFMFICSFTPSPINGL